MIYLFGNPPQGWEKCPCGEEKRGTGMGIAVFSDIHSNYVAFQKCLDMALKQGIETFIFLGDYLGELAYPQRTMDILYTLKQQYRCYFVRGNKEDYWICHEENPTWEWKKGTSSSGALYYTYSNLMPEDMEFFKTMPICQTIHVDGMPSITICHGTPYNNNKAMLPEDEWTREMARECRGDLILCGHTHVRNVFTVGEKKVLNPGSVGAALHSGGKAQFAILHEKEGAWEPELIQVEYDREKVITELRESGLMKDAPYWSVISSHLIRFGETSHAEVLKLAANICRKETGTVNWREIPEKYWKQAVSILPA